MTKYAIADVVPEKKQRYLTAGKPYKIDHNKQMIDDEGDFIAICEQNSAHLDGGDWRIVDADHEDVVAWNMKIANEEGQPKSAGGKVIIGDVVQYDPPAMAPNENVIRNEKGAVKFDHGKAPIMRGCVQRFPLALQQIALVSDYGRAKYGTFDGWEKLDDAFERYNDALGRHMLLRKSEGEYDVNDSGLPHLAQVAWNALATLELALRNGTIEMTTGNAIDDSGKPVLGSNGRGVEVAK